MLNRTPTGSCQLMSCVTLEKAGVVGKLHEQFVSTSGLANPLANSRRLGREIAQKLKQEGVDAVILTST